MVFAMLYSTVYPAISVYIRNSLKRGTKDKNDCCLLPFADCGYFGNKNIRLNAFEQSEGAK